MMRVSLGLTRPAELELDAFSFHMALTTVASFLSYFHRNLIFSPILGMLALRAAAAAFTRLAGCSLDSVGVTSSSRDFVRSRGSLPGGD